MALGVGERMLLEEQGLISPNGTRWWFASLAWSRQFTEWGIRWAYKPASYHDSVLGIQQQGRRMWTYTPDFYLPDRLEFVDVITTLPTFLDSMNSVRANQLAKLGSICGVSVIVFCGLPWDKDPKRHGWILMPGVLDWMLELRPFNTLKKYLGMGI